MSDENQKCPECGSIYGYQEGEFWVCPECFHEWSLSDKSTPTDTEESAPKFLDANGVLLQDGDTVVTVKDLKAGKDTIKAGTKVKGIRLLDDPKDGHDISCKVPGFGSMYLKCSVVKKAKS